MCDMSFREGQVHDAMVRRLLSGSSEIQKNILAAILGPGARKGWFSQFTQTFGWLYTRRAHTRQTRRNHGGSAGYCQSDRIVNRQ